jgi:pimeloyl-ACP methyl ester carboxylesterase
MERTAVRQTSRIRSLATLAVAALLVGQVVGSAVAAAESPPTDPRDLTRLGVPLEAASAAWASEASTTVSLATPLALVPSDGKMHLVSVNGHRLAIWCRGVGSPTVILEHGIGYGVDSASWATVQVGIAKETRVCRYDRAFVGHSADAKAGRSMPDLTSDLVALMTAALIPGPYILVGHSFGGLVVREFAKLHPRSVVGVVLVDGSPRSAIVGLDLGSERLNRTKVLPQLAALEKPGALGRIPLVVITRGIAAGTTWRAEQAKMLKLSSSSRHVIATKSDHWIQLRQPDLVVRQVLTVLHTIRRHS